MPEDPPNSPRPATSRAGSRPPGAWDAPSPEEMQAMLPQYQFVALLGRGGMGAVYRALQISLDRDVAIKVLPGDLLDDTEANFTERFKNEARLMAKMNHPAIVKIHDFGQTKTGLLYIVMEFIDGTDVSKMIASQGRLPEAHALAITAHVCDALEYAHNHGVIHRDIKPANVLINMEGAVKVADFGLAKANDPGLEGLTQPGTAMGTPDFVAPEALIPGIPLDGRADIYAVGVMLYQMLTGNIPRGMWTMPSIMVQTDPRFDGIIARAMQLDREARHRSALELRRDLDVILTVPYVKHDDKHTSSAIPQEQLIAAKKQQAMVVHRPAQKPAIMRAGQPSRRPPPQQVITYAPEKSSYLLTFVAAVLIGGAALFLFQNINKPADAPRESAAANQIESPVKVADYVAAPAPLPPGVQVFGGHRYLFLPGPFVKNKDSDKAKALGGHLVTITSAEEQKWIEQTFADVISLNSKGQCRAGGKRMDDGSWSWMTGETWSYTNWDDGFPRNNSDLILLLSHKDRVLKWQGTYWSFKRSAIIEWDDLSTPIPSAVLAAPLASAIPAPADALPFGGHRYKHIPGNVSWKEANDLAAGMGGHLATLTSREEDEWVRKTFVESLPKERLLHIGGFKTAGDSPWLWVTGEPWSFENWKKQEERPEPRGVTYMNFGYGLPQWAANWGWAGKIHIASGPEQGQPRTEGFLVEWDDDRVSSPVLAIGALTFGGHRYQLVPDKTLTWTQAKAAAEAMGGHLATITSKEENDWIAGNVISKFDRGLGAWIGGTSEGSPGNWRWITGEPFAFTSWNPGEPSNNDGEPALFFSNSETGKMGWGDNKNDGVGKKDRRAGFLVEWDRYTDAAPALASDGEGTAQAINLLSGVDVKRDAVRGSWEMRAGELFLDAANDGAGNGSPWNFLCFKVATPEEYDFAVEFTIVSGRPFFSQVLPVPGGIIEWRAQPREAGSTMVYGFGPMLDRRWITDGKRTEAVVSRPEHGVASQRHRYLVEVRKGSLRAVLDGQEMVRWSGDFTRFDRTEKNWPDVRFPGVGGMNTGIIYHKAELRAAGALSPRLAKIENQFKEAYERDVTKSSAGKAIADLDGKYLAALDREIADATKAGKLNDVLALKAEKQRITDKAALPAADAVDIVSSLKNLRDTYRKAAAPLIKARDAAADPVYARYDEALSALEVELTQKNATSDAQTVKALRESLKRQRQPGTAGPMIAAAAAQPSASSKPAEAAPKNTGTPSTLPPEMLTQTPPKPFTPEEAIHWALSLNGSARVLKGKDEIEIIAIGFIPKGKFSVIGLKIGEQQPLHVVSLAGLSGLADLRELNLDKNLITDAGLAFLPPLPKLESISLNECGLTDAGLAHLSRQSALTNLQARNNDITGAGLSQLSRAAALQSLTIGSKKVTADGVSAIARCTALQSLDLACGGPVAYTSLEALAVLQNLKSLRLGQCATDALVQSLSAVPQLQALDLSNAPITDFALDRVSAMISLRDLNFYGCKDLTDSGYLKLLPLGKNITRLIPARTRLSDAGFKVLSTKLTEITEIDLGYTGVSPAGLASLANLRKLSALGIHATHCTDEGLKHLSRVLNLKSFGISDQETLTKDQQDAVKRATTRWTF